MTTAAFLAAEIISDGKNKMITGSSIGSKCCCREPKTVSNKLQFNGVDNHRSGRDESISVWSAFGTKVSRTPILYHDCICLQHLRGISRWEVGGVLDAVSPGSQQLRQQAQIMDAGSGCVIDQWMIPFTSPFQLNNNNNNMNYRTMTTSLFESMTSSLSSSSSPYAPHWDLHPRVYTVDRVPSSDIGPPLYTMIDGNISKDIWLNVSFSETFNDIQGGVSMMEYDGDGDDVIITPTDTTTSATGGNVDGDAQQQQQPRVPAVTRFKALYDDMYLYIVAQIDPSPGLPTIATFTERNSPIYQRDSDFEVFIDIDHSTHNYKEFEVNAINTVWNLYLDKPYENNGHEHSGRIAQPGERDYYDVRDQITATHIVSGSINNNDNNEGAVWTIEMAWSLSDLHQRIPSTIATTADHPQQQQLSRRSNHNQLVVDSRCSNLRTDGSGDEETTECPPAAGTSWRINFSRVELCGDINWTWQAQRKWDPIHQQYSGFINMHLPDAWGYLHFIDTSNNNSNNNNIVDNDDDDSSMTENGRRAAKLASARTETTTSSSSLSWRDPTWPAKLTAMTVYYALKYHYDTTGHFTSNVNDLIVPTDIVQPFQIQIDLQSDDPTYFLVTVISRIDQSSVSVQSDRLLSVLQYPIDNNNDGSATQQ